MKIHLNTTIVLPFGVLFDVLAMPERFFCSGIVVLREESRCISIPSPEPIRKCLLRPHARRHAVKYKGSIGAAEALSLKGGGVRTGALQNAGRFRIGPGRRSCSRLTPFREKSGIANASLGLMERAIRQFAASGKNAKVGLPAGCKGLFRPAHPFIPRL